MFWLLPFEITSVLFYQMNGILFIDFNLVARAFLKFDWYKMLNGYVDLSFSIFSLRKSKMLRMYQSKRYKIENGLNETWVMSNSCIFVTFLISSYRQKSSICFIYFFLYGFFFHKNSWFTGQQGKEEAISITPLYFFHPLHRHLYICRLITGDNSLLYVAINWARAGNFWFPSASH